MKYISKIYLFFFVFVINLNAFSQEFIRYGIAEGLSSNEVTAVCQDKNYYWIGTTDGLCRFDGQNFKTYRKTGKQNGLTSNNIETLLLDSNGKIWIGYKTKGVDIFCPLKEEFISLESLTNNPVPHHVISIFEDSKKNIWLGSWEEGVFKVKVNAGGKTYNITKHHSGYTFSSFREQPEGMVWMGTFFGGFIYNLNSNHWQKFGNESTISSIVNGGANTIYYSSWDKGVRKVNYEVNDSIIVTSDANVCEIAIAKMGQSTDKSLIVGTWGGGIKKITSPESNPILQNLFGSSLGNIYVDDISTGKDGSIWISTYGNGLLKFSENKPIIKSLNLGWNIQAPISEIYELHDRKIVIGTRGSGSYIYNPQNQQLTPVAMEKKRDINAYLLCAYQNDGLLLLGDDDQGLFYLSTDKQSGKTLFYKEQLSKVSAIYNEGNKFWFGTKQNGFFSADYNTLIDEFENIKQFETLGRDEITGFLPCVNNKLWISSHNGLYLYNFQTNQLEEYASNPVNESVYSIVKAPSSDIIWMATSSGVFSVSLTEKIVRPILSPSVLPAGAVKTLKMDSGHNLWFSIGNQLFCYKKNESYLFEVNLKGMIASPIISSEIVFNNQSENLLIGSTEGITVIDLNKLFKDNNPSKIIFTDLDIDLRNIQVGDTIYGNVPLEISTENKKKMELSYKCKWISFHFSEIGDNILKNQYQYRIVGFSDEWKSFDITKPITISQLPPGEYVFEVQNYNASQSKSRNLVWELNLRIIPPFWQTYWFYSIVALVILLILASIGYYLLRSYRQKIARRIQRERRQQEIELLKEKESFFMGLSHDILTPFMLIQSPAKDLLSDPKMSDDNKEKAKIIHKNANFLSNMFSTILDFKKTKDEISESDVSEFDLIAFAKLIINSFLYLARSKEIHLSFNSNVEILFIKTDKVKLERILYNLLSNALKFTPVEGKVSLTITKLENHIELFIEDNGVGIASENKDRIFEKFYQEERSKNADINDFGLGLYIVKSFVAHIGGTISLDSKENEGTSILISLPSQIIVSPKYDSYATDIIKQQIDNLAEDSKPIILLVEDNEELNQYLKDSLSSHFCVISASNGTQGLLFARQVIPEIIISDLMMPEMDGLTLCKKIKEDELLSDCFFVLLTAKNSSEDEVLSYKEGVDIFIKKPIDVDSLINQMNNIVSTRLKRKKQIMHTLLLQKGDITQINPKDAFMREVMKVVEENMVNPDFKLDELAEKMHLSKTVLHRKFKDVLDETPSLFIRNIRLKRAENLLLNSDLTVAEIAYLTGFNHSHYFIKCFREVYNDTPKNYRQKSGTKDE